MLYFFGDKPVILVSHYMDGTLSSPISKEFSSVVDYCNRERLPLVVGCDANSHSEAWGNSDCNPRGLILESFLASSNLSWSNVGTMPTWSRKNASSIIDLTLHNSLASDLISDWRVSPVPSDADHAILKFRLSLGRPIPRSYRDTSKCNWDTFREVLKLMFSEKPFRYSPSPSSSVISSLNGHLEWCLVHAFEAACPLSFRSSKAITSWWNPEISTLRSKVRGTKRRAKASGDSSLWAEYKAGHKELKKLIKRSKRVSWQEYTSKVSSFKDVSRLSKVLQRVDSGSLGSLKYDDGSFTKSPAETLDLLASKLIPSSVNPPTPVCRSQSPSDFSIVDKVLGLDRLDRAVNELQRNKAPGPDKVRPDMVIEAWDIIRSPVRYIMKHSLLLGMNPRQ